MHEELQAERAVDEAIKTWMDIWRTSKGWLSFGLRMVSKAGWTASRMHSSAPMTELRAKIGGLVPGHGRRGEVSTTWLVDNKQGSALEAIRWPKALEAERHKMARALAKAHVPMAIDRDAATGESWLTFRASERKVVEQRLHDVLHGMGLSAEEVDRAVSGEAYVDPQGTHREMHGVKWDLAGTDEKGTQTWKARLPILDDHGKPTSHECEATLWWADWTARGEKALSAKLSIPGADGDADLYKLTSWKALGLDEKGLDEHSLGDALSVLSTKLGSFAAQGGYAYVHGLDVEATAEEIKAKVKEIQDKRMEALALPALPPAREEQPVLMPDEGREALERLAERRKERNSEPAGAAQMRAAKRTRIRADQQRNANRPAGPQPRMARRHTR